MLRDQIDKIEVSLRFAVKLEKGRCTGIVLFCIRHGRVWTELNVYNLERNSLRSTLNLPINRNRSAPTTVQDSMDKIDYRFGHAFGLPLRSEYTFAY